MKMHYIFRSIQVFVCSFLVCMNIHADENKQDLRLLKIHYSNSIGEKGVTNLHYDPNGLMNKALWHLVDGKRNSLNNYEYDKNGLLIKKYREFSDKTTSIQTFKYSLDNQLVFEDFNRSDGVKGEVVYKYDATGKLLRADCRGLNGWFHGVIKYKCGPEGLKRSAVIEQEGEKRGTISYSYHKSGLLQKEHWIFTGKWDQTFVYEYDETGGRKILPFTSSNPFININTGYRVKSEGYDYSGKSGGPSEYVYNGHKLVKKIFTRSDGLKTETFYFYNSMNELTKSLRRYADGRSAVFTYSHNGRRQLSWRTGLGTDGFRSEEKYTYDEQGQLETASWNNFDNWLTGSINFKHNKKGQLTEGYFTGTGNKKFNAVIEFKHDNNDNVVSIDWKFSFAGTQTYTFSYMKD